MTQNTSGELAEAQLRGLAELHGDYRHAVEEFLAGDEPTYDDAWWSKRDREVAEQRALEVVEQERQRREAVRAQMVAAGAPLKDAKRILDDSFGDTPALVAARAAHEERVGLTVLSGPRGVGKTTAACWWLARPRTAPDGLAVAPPRWITAPGLARLDRYDREDKATFAALTRSLAVVIDDLGMELQDRAGGFLSALDELLDARYAATLPTLLTTNIPGRDWKQGGQEQRGFYTRYGGRVADRMREVGRFVGLVGESLRGKPEPAPGGARLRPGR